MKLKAKKRSDFACVVCGELFVDVHHIIPQKDGGPHKLDNAAALCPLCHRRYGGNPDLRKELRHLRDHRWEICADRRANPVTLGIVAKVDQLARDHRDGREQNERLFVEVKDQMTELTRGLHQEASSATTTPQIIHALSAFAIGSSSASASMAGASRCPQCNTDSIPPNSRVCDNCGYINDDSAFV